MSQLNLIPHIWFIILVWIALYIGDYYLTIYTAQKITTEMAQHLEFERSFELNPLYEGDVNQLRKISPRFILMLLLTSGFLLVAWWVTRLLQLPALFDFLAGELILLEMTVQLRHLRNLALIQSYQPGAIIGHLRYAYWFGLRLSGWELFAVSASYLILGILLGSWFLAGGAVGNFLAGLKHWNRSKKIYRESAQIGE
jgi:uncharacterized ion transporter superfamily protein YfcC